ncbi:TolC family protein [Coprobacter tertius]|uniref:TolC family protein n=1 Tax=Coprobacter tertius TaxID=2944915 RepID=A0ABT1MIH6_9BACT|nr:TolC family protein [Coprobacter tertius]MCP9611666.1 TolC family protein [Coprobacter tertius]
MNIKWKLASAFVLFTLAKSGIYAQSQEETSVLRIDLEKAVEIAINENPTIKVADMEIVRKNYGKKEVLGSLFPQIGASADYSYALKKQVMYMDFDMSGLAPGGGTGVQENAIGNDGLEVGRDNTITMGFNLQFPVIAPALWKNIKLTQADVEQSLEAARSSRLTLINQVQKAYYNVMMTQDSYSVLKQSYDNAKLNAENYRNKFNQGTASEYDVLRSEVQVRNLEPGLLQAENGVKLAKLQLKVLMGIDMGVEIEATNRLADYENTMYSETMAIDTSLRNNTSLKQLDLQTEYLKRAMEVQKMSWYPTLAFTGMYNWLDMFNNGKYGSSHWNPYSTIGLSLSIPIFQGGSRYYKVKQAKVAVAQMKYNRQDLHRNLSMQVQSSLDNIQKSVKQIASNSEGVKQAEKAYMIMQKSFEIGTATFVELNDADLALTNSRLAYYQAIYDYLAAKSELELLLGNKDYSKSDDN